MDLDKEKTPLLSRLPGEVRNLIFDLCIADALSRPKSPSRRSLVQLASLPAILYWTKPEPQTFTVTVLPQWCGPGSIKTEGIGSLPLLFTNKQIFMEVSSLVYSKVEKLTIGPYGLQYSDEDPNKRWQCAYNLLRMRPNLLLHVKHIVVHLPWLKHDLLRNYWKSVGNPQWQTVRRSHAFSIVPGLAQFLKNCPSLDTLKIVLIAEVPEPPNMEPLLQVFDICGHRTTIEILEPDVTPLQNRNFPIDFRDVSKWHSAWQDCLVKSGRAVVS